MDSILAHDIIHDQGQRHAFHVVGKSLAKIIVHANLPIDAVQGHLDRNIYTTRTYLSPFWKSTTEVGTKNPWQQAVAPMPVTSKCDQLEFANSMALCVLQVLGYGHMSWGPWRIKKTDSYIIISLSTIQVCSIQVWIGHESLSCWKQSILGSGSGPHMFCREVAIHDECVDQLIADT